MRLVAADKAWAIWPRVRELLDRAACKIGRPVAAEHMFHAIRTGVAALYTVHAEDESIDGILILQKLIEPSGEPILFVWYASGELKEHMDDCVRELEGLARSIGASRIQMRSARRGWERGMGEYWRQVDVTYEHEVT